MKIRCLPVLLLAVANALVLKDAPDSFVQVASKVAKKGDGFDGFGAPDPFNQNDDDEVDQGEPNAPEKENPNEDANMVSGNDDDSFLQVSSSSISSSGQLVVRTVQDLAKQHHSAALAQLASRIGVVMEYGGSASDVFAKVKGLITDMIAKLEKEAEEDAAEKAYCDEEMAKTEAKKGELDDEIAKLVTKMDQAASTSTRLKDEVKAILKKYEANFVCLPASPAYYLDRTNNGMYR